MKTVNYIIIVLCFILLGAHFFRLGWYVIAACSLSFPLLLFIKKSWVSYTMQLVLVLASLEWIRTLLDTMQYRMAAEIPWLRMAIILAIVAAVNLYAAWSFQSKSLRKIYKR